MNKERMIELAQIAKELKILYVEDNEEARRSTLYLLEEFFDDIVVAIDGQDGLDKFNQNSFDLIISDINMPKLNGIEMTREILAKKHDQAIIIISAHNESDMLAELLNLGVEYFVQKPIVLEKLVQMLLKSTKRIIETRLFHENVKKIERLNRELDSLVKGFDEHVIASRTDLKGVITYVSKAFCKIAGYSKEELVGKPHNMVRHPDMPKEAFKDMWQTIQNNKIWQGEVKNLKKDGSYYWVKANVAPYVDQGSGEIIGYSAIREDITLRKEVVELSSKINDLLNNSGEGFLSFNSNLHIESGYSKECERLFEKELVSKDISEVLFSDDSDKKEIFQNGIKNILEVDDEFSKQMMLSLLPQKILKNNLSIKLEYKLLKNDRFMLIASDISEKIKLEKRLENERQKHNKIVTIANNPSEFNLLLKDFTTFLDQIDKHLSGSKSEFYRQIHTFKGLFAQKQMSILVNALHHIESHITKSIKADTKIDIDLNKLKSALKSDLKDVYEILGEDFLKRFESEPVDTKAIIDIERVLHDLVESKKLDKETFCLLLDKVQNLRAYSLKNLLSSYPSLVKNVAKKLNKEILDFEIDVDSSIKVPASYRNFIKSLVHVFRNSIDHGIEDGELRLSANKSEAGMISCKIEQNGDELKIVISDDGRGIPLHLVKQKAIKNGILDEKEFSKLSKEEQLKLIFADNFSTKDRVSELSGRGVGLAAVKSELDKLGGELQVQSEENKGTVFIFTIKNKRIAHEYA